MMEAHPGPWPPTVPISITYTDVCRVEVNFIRHQQPPYAQDKSVPNSEESKTEGWFPKTTIIGVKFQK